MLLPIITILALEATGTTHSEEQAALNDTLTDLQTKLAVALVKAAEVAYQEGEAVGDSTFLPLKLRRQCTMSMVQVFLRIFKMGAMRTSIPSQPMTLTIR